MVAGEPIRVPPGNPLRNAPHTADDLAAGEWTHPYTRAEAVFPAGTTALAKYWPPVGRIDNVHGDRNLVRAWPAVDGTRDAAD